MPLTANRAMRRDRKGARRVARLLLVPAALGGAMSALPLATTPAHAEWPGMCDMGMPDLVNAEGTWHCTCFVEGYSGELFCSWEKISDASRKTELALRNPYTADELLIYADFSRYGNTNQRESVAGLKSLRAAQAQNRGAGQLALQMFTDYWNGSQWQNVADTGWMTNSEATSIMKKNVNFSFPPGGANYGWHRTTARGSFYDGVNWNESSVVYAGAYNWASPF